MTTIKVLPNNLHSKIFPCNSQISVQYIFWQNRLQPSERPVRNIFEAPRLGLLLTQCSHITIKEYVTVFINRCIYEN